MNLSRFALAAAALGSSLSATPVFAQAESTLLEPAIPAGFDRGRNTSVTDRARPDYDPVGIPVGGFNLFPRLDVGVGVTDNVFFNPAEKMTDGFTTIAPRVQLNSDWNRNTLQFRGGANLERYFNETRRNQNAWDLGALGRYELGSSMAVTAEAQLARLYETPFSGAISSDIAVLSNYLRNYLSLRGQYQAGQSRLTLAVDHTGFDFSGITLASGAKLSQEDRDRTIDRIVGQAEYAFSPAMALYGQLSYGQIDYSRNLLNGQPNRDSDAWRLIGGGTFDLTSLIRGQLGIGYVWRNFDSPIYRNVSGLSVEGRVEYFPTELATITLQVSRLIEDSSIGANSAFFNNQVSAQVDYEVLTNFILTGLGQYARQDFIDSPVSADIYRLGIQGRYLSSRRVNLRGGITYVKRSSGDIALGSDTNELRGLLTLTIQR